MNKRILRQCLKIAKDYLPKHPEFHCYPMYSFVVQGDKIVEWDTNNNGVPDGPLYPMYAARVSHLDGTPKTHAEVNSYRKAKGLLNRNKDFEVVNIRLTRQGEMRIAAPCSCCYQFLKSLGASKAYFTTSAGWAKMAF